MAGIEVDLNTRILSASHNVFVVRPGKNYRFYPDFIADKAIFPDLPALELEDKKVLSSYEDLDARVRRARAVRAWHRAGRPDDTVPPRNLSDYAGTKGRSIGQLESVVRTYFERAAKGDLVIVPPKGYKEQAYIGELTHKPDRVTNITNRIYPREKMSSRDVGWLATLDKRRLARPILEALEKPSAIFLLERSLRTDIYEAAYGNYILSEDDYSSRFDVSSQTFTVDDELLLQSFFKFIAVNVRAIEHDGKIFGYEEAIFQNAGNYVPYLQTEIHSPGSLILNCVKLTPLVAAVMLAMAVSVGPQAIELAHSDRIVLKNSKAPIHDVCTARVREEALQFLRLLELDQWVDACEKAKEVEKRTGVKSPVQIK